VKDFHSCALCSLTRKKEQVVLLYILIGTFDKTSFIKEKCHIFTGWNCSILFCVGKMCVFVLGLVSSFCSLIATSKGLFF